MENARPRISMRNGIYRCLGGGVVGHGTTKETAFADWRRSRAQWLEIERVVFDTSKSMARAAAVCAPRAGGFGGT